MLLSAGTRFLYMIYTLTIQKNKKFKKLYTSIKCVPNKCNHRQILDNASEMEHNKPIHQNIQYTQNRFNQVNWISKNYVHVDQVVIVPLLSLYQCHCFCQSGLLTVQMDYSTDAIFPQLSNHHLA